MKPGAIITICLCAAAAIIVACQGAFFPGREAIFAKSVAVGRVPALRPDYTGITIPPNIGPLNVAVAEDGIRYYARAYGLRGDTVTVCSRKPQIVFPLKKWQRLLSCNEGGTLKIDLFVEQHDKSWRRYATVENVISNDRIDPYIDYRTLSLLYRYSRDLRIYQRSLETNRESEVLNALNFFPGCCNCHTFLKNDPSHAFIHTRSQDFGSPALLVMNDTIVRIDTKFGYTTWHPSGKLAVFSVNKVDQCFHAAWKDPRDAFDYYSSLKVFTVATRKIDAIPALSRKSTLETWPCWSPDGRYLYFSSAPQPWSDYTKMPPDSLERVRYSLLRIFYDESSGVWGEIDTVLSSGATGLSITQPRVSPDGRFVLFCMHRYGPSPYLQPSSDLYIMDIATKRYEPLAANSIWSESWHTWSSNGRWIAFTSKRDGGVLGKIYFCHIDAGGKSSKPFVLPQNDPTFYDSFIKTYNIPEFATARFTVSQRDLVAAIRSGGAKNQNAPAVPGAASKETAWPLKTE